ncbi:unnamed protein product [Lepeophtheirus salmonis]|uniref:(salmon louse) hypothetical protein n=1 Tax=Lepeophtheirus salmonis TaxID=72036 RepID=A0A7R8D4J2_LEPSM|nr:unnamed protein product [Lepeophtheirus salmonis]CAF2973054.1 unnamed protein product [Lepeophtheirus salmonis]
MSYVRLIGAILLLFLLPTSSLFGYNQNLRDEKQSLWTDLRFGSDIKSTKSYGLSHNLNAMTQLSYQHRVRHRRIKGKYSVKEEIVKKIERIHPCGLEEAAVKVSFPGIKSEMLVSFLGYKEPNLIHVNRFIGSDKKIDKVKELILEEHEECGCSCLTLSPTTCRYPSHYSNDTCSCKCEQSHNVNTCFGPNRYWDVRTCSCVERPHSRSPSLTEEKYPISHLPKGDVNADHLSHDSTSSYAHHIKNVGDMELDYTTCSHCLECMNMAGISSFYKKRYGGSPSIKSWVVLAFSLTLILLLFCTSLHYWRKSKALLKSLRRDDYIKTDPFMDSSSMPLQIMTEHQIDFDHNGDGTMAELFNPLCSGTANIPSSNPILLNSSNITTPYTYKNPSISKKEKPSSSNNERLEVNKTIEQGAKKPSRSRGDKQNLEKSEKRRRSSSSKNKR